MQEKNSFNIKISMLHNQTKETAEIPALLDSGARGIFINQNHVQKMNYKLTEMKKPVKAYNVNGTENKKETIKYYISLKFSLNGRAFKEWFYMTRLRKQKAILGLP